MNRYVIDASSVAAYLLGESAEMERGALADLVAAPALIDVEVTQVLRGLLHHRVISTARADACREDLAALPIRRYPTAPLLDAAWRLREIASTYDALYVALSVALDATLVTRDRRLGRSVSDFVSVQIAG